MNNFTSQILAQQLQDSHSLLKMTMEGVTNEIASFSPPGTANSIASTYAHIVMSEDYLINVLMQNKEPQYETNWKNKTGISNLPEADPKNSFPKWVKDQKIDIDQIKTYADAIFAESEEYIRSLSDEDLHKNIDMATFGMDPRPATFVIGSITINNLNLHIGEISAIKGIQGLKGYPM